MVQQQAFLTEARKAFHTALLNSVLDMDASGIPTNADRSNRASVAIAKGIIERIGQHTGSGRLAGQSSGDQFESVCAEYIRTTHGALEHLRPGKWHITKGVGGGRMGIARFEQYTHLEALAALSLQSPELAAALGSDYLIKPDVVIYREPEPDEAFNASQVVVSEKEALFTGLRSRNSALPILHASISCKWTIRSDRAQNARSEGLNLVRNRKGRLPHITVITGEPTPSRISSIALGTGDIDHVYHFALHELIDTVKDLKMNDAEDLINIMIQGKRLRDISDLPLDLIV